MVNLCKTGLPWKLMNKNIYKRCIKVLENYSDNPNTSLIENIQDMQNQRNSYLTSIKYIPTQKYITEC